MTETHPDDLERRSRRLAQRMVLVLPGFGRWASAMRDFETPYGKAGIRQLEVLYHLRHNLLDPSKPNATELADRFQIQRSVVTRVLARLEAGGYILREPDPRDGRAFQITITDIGRKLSDYVEQEYFQEMRDALGELDSADVACLERSMDILTGAAINLGLQVVEERIAKIDG